MMDATIAPEYGGGGNVLVTVLKSKAKTAQGEIPVISVDTCGKPILLIPESGEARLVRPRKGRSSYSNTMTYASRKVFKIDKPFQQPISALIALYEQALATLA